MRNDINFADVYLPSVYHGDTNLKKFVYENFQREYLENDEKIAQFHTQLNPLTCDSKMLKVIAGWLGGEMFLGLGEERTRKLLAVLPALQRSRGTVLCLKLLLFKLTDCRAVINEELGGDYFTVTVDCEVTAEMVRIVREFVPSGLRFSILRKDTHSAVSEAAPDCGYVMG
jgi:phage tail-like protein